MFRSSIFIFLVFTICLSCKSEQDEQLYQVDIKSDEHQFDRVPYEGQGALLASRIPSLDDLKALIQIDFKNSSGEYVKSNENCKGVRLLHRSNGLIVESILDADISQEDIMSARDSGLIERLSLAINSPFAVRNRVQLGDIYVLARWRYDKYGWGDVAFYDLAEAAKDKINTADLAYLNSRDSSEKGYINTFNHITAQALITTCFSEELADFIADVHERYNMPELVTGSFTSSQLNDLNNNPVDNYVDMINNEWGQELGLRLKKKYGINRQTYWTNTLLSDYLNDIQSYYSWAFQIGMEPFSHDEEVVVRFSEKLNSIMKNRSLEIENFTPQF